MTVTHTTFKQRLLDAALPAPVGLQCPEGAPATKRFDVYRNNVAVGLSDALETAFPVLRKLVGDTFFRAMAGVYLRKHPPSSPLMMFYGAQMPEFLRHFAPVQSLPYLPDIAILELAMRRSYHAADAPAIDPQTIARLAPDVLLGARLRFAPAVQVIASNYPIHAIYTANTTPDAPAPVMRPETVLITRPAFDPQIHAISQNVAQCITALMSAVPLDTTLADDGRDFGATLGLLLAQSAITELF